MTEKITIWTRAFIGISLISFVQSLGQNMMNTLIPRYADHLGADASMVGIVSSMFAVTGLITCVVAGAMMSSLSKWWMLVFSNSMVFLALLIYSLAESIPLMILGRLLHGVGAGLAAPMGLVLVSETLPKERLASGIGVYSLWQAITTAIGPSIGLWLVDMIGYRNSFRCGAAVLLLAALLTVWLCKGTKLYEGKFVFDYKHMVAKEGLITTVVMFFLAAASACISAYLTLFADLCEVSDIGLYFTVYAVCMMFTRPICGMLSDKVGIDRVLVVGMIMFMISFFVIGGSRNLSAFLLAGVTTAFGYGICHPMVQTMNMQIVPKEGRGVAGTTLYIGISSGYIFGPVFAGKVIVAMENRGYSALTSYSVMFYLMAVLVVIGFAIFMSQHKKIAVRIKKMVMEEG